MAALLGLLVAELALRVTGWCQDKWTSSTGNFTKKRRDITEELFKATGENKQ